MKLNIRLITPLLVLLAMSCEEPLEYYNHAVAAGNMGISLHEMESKIERIQEGYAVQPIDLAKRTDMRVQVNESYLKNMSDYLGNEDSDLMMKAAIAYLQCDVSNAKNQKTIALLNEIDNALTPEDLQKVLEPYETYLDSIYDIKAELFDTYNTEVTKYAEAHNIEEHFYGPNLQPIEKEEYIDK